MSVSRDKGLVCAQTQSEATLPEIESEKEGKGLLQRVQYLEKRRSQGANVLDITFPKHVELVLGLVELLNQGPSPLLPRGWRKRLEGYGEKKSSFVKAFHEYLSKESERVIDGEMHIYQAFGCGRRGSRQAEVVHSSPWFASVERNDVVGIAGEGEEGEVRTKWAMRVDIFFFFKARLEDDEVMSRGCIFGRLYHLWSDDHSYPWRGDSSYASLKAQKLEGAFVSEVESVTGRMTMLPDFEKDEPEGKNYVIFKEPPSIEVL